MMSPTIHPRRPEPRPDPPVTLEMVWKVLLSLSAAVAALRPKELNQK